MSAAAPWSVKGIDPKAREAAKDLARRANMTLGEWLNQMILEDEAPLDQPPPARAPRKEPYRAAGGGRVMAPEHPADEVGKVAMALDRLSARIEASDRRSAEALGRIAGGEREVNAIAARFEGAVEEVQSETAKLSERLRRIEAEANGPRSAQALRSLEGALGRVAERLYDNEGKLEGQIADLSARVTEAEQSGPAGALRDLSASLTALDNRLKTLEESGGAAMQERLDAMSSDLSRRFEAASARTAAQVAAIDRRSAESLEKMGRQVVGVTEGLAGRLASVERQSVEAVERVGGEVSRIASAVEQRLARADSINAGALEKLGGEIARITERLAERIASAERRSANAMDDVGEQVARVTEKLSQRQERTNSELAERIRQSEERTARLLEEAREKIDQSLSRGRGAQPEPAPARHAAASARAAALFMAEPAPAWAHSPFEAADEFDSPRLAPAEPFPEPQTLAPSALTAGDFPAAPDMPETLSQADFDAAAGFDRVSQFEADTAFETPAAAAAHVPPEPEPRFSEPETPSPVTAAFEPPEAFRPTPPIPEAEAVPEDMFQTGARALSTREVIENARSAARAAAQENTKGKGAKTQAAEARPKMGLPPLFTRKTKKASPLNAAALAVAVGAGGLGMAITALYLQDRAENAAPIGQAPAAAPAAAQPQIAAAGEAAIPSLTADGGRAAIALSPSAPAAIPPPGIPPTARASTTVAAAPAVSADSLYREGARRIEAKDNAGLEPLRRAATMGHAPAQFYLSKLYESGEAGLKKDLAEARLWNQRAAENGEVKAMYNLALELYEGAGGARNTTSAAAWFRRAAEAGLSDGQYNLALLYERGVGVAANPADAYKWYLIAAQGGDATSKAEARGAANRVRAQLSPEAQAQAERAAAGFRPAAAATAGSTGVATVQKALNKIGYYNGSQDGVANPGLQAAITAYQRDQGLQPTGAIDTALVTRLAVYTR